MRIEAIVWLVTALALAAIGGIYLAVGGSAAGGTLLLISGGFGALIGGWLWNWNRLNDPRAEDRSDADMADEAVEIGVFVTSSGRPVALAAAGVVITLGLVVGWWLSLIGLAFLIVHVVGLVTDSR